MRVVHKDVWSLNLEAVPKVTLLVGEDALDIHFGTRFHPFADGGPNDEVHLVLGIAVVGMVAKISGSERRIRCDGFPNKSA